MNTSLDTLAERIDNLIKQNDRQHTDNTKRLDQIAADQREASSRLTMAEKAIGVHWWALCIIGPILLAVLAAMLAKVF